MKLSLVQEFREFWHSQVFPPRAERTEDDIVNRQSIAVFAIALAWGVLGFSGVVVLALSFQNAWLLFLWVPWLIITVILAKFDGWYYRTHDCSWGR